MVCVACAAPLFAPIGERWTKFDERSNAIAKSEWTGAGEGGNAVKLAVARRGMSCGYELPYSTPAPSSLPLSSPS